MESGTSMDGIILKEIGEGSSTLSTRKGKAFVGAGTAPMWHCPYAYSLFKQE